MKKWNIAYWIVSGLFALFMLMSGYFDIVTNDQVREIFSGLGLSLALAQFIGVAKFLGVIGMFQPWSKELRVFAHAGFIFVFVGAAYLHLAAGQPFAMAIPALVMLAFAGTSYWLAIKAKRV